MLSVCQSALGGLGRTDERCPLRVPLAEMMNIVEDLDFAEYVDPAHNPMIPHIVVLKPGLVIYKIYNGYWSFDRPTMADLRQGLRAVTR